MLLDNPDIRATWLILVSFRRKVPKAVVNVAHAVMTIFFRACESRSYIACRPERLPNCPQSWGLNELCSLGQHGLAGYNRIRHGQVKDEADLVYERNVLAGQRRRSSKRQEYYNPPFPSIILLTRNSVRLERRFRRVVPTGPA